MKLDEDLIGRLRLGDEAAFETIFWKYNPRVFHFISSLLFDKSLAEDLTQNVFLKIWEKRESINVDLGFDAYLFTIARNLVYKETEKRLVSESVALFLENQPDAIDSLVEEKMDARFLKEYIDDLIEQLPPSRKNIFLLSRHDFLSNKEIAARLSISEKTVETQLYRALHFLKQKMTDDNLLALLLLCMINEC